MGRNKRPLWYVACAVPHQIPHPLRHLIVGNCAKRALYRHQFLSQGNRIERVSVLNSGYLAVKLAKFSKPPTFKGP
jgi:hypothetical protein